MKKLYRICYYEQIKSGNLKLQSEPQHYITDDIYAMWQKYGQLLRDPLVKFNGVDVIIPGGRANQGI